MFPLKVIKELTKCSLQCYGKINRLVPHLIHEKNSLPLHNKIASKNQKCLSSNSFVGTMACGASCWVMHHVLKENNIHTKMMKKSIGSGDYYQDHCFLLYDDNIIIDPTYKQFFTDYIDKENEYTELLFNKYPFVFVGNVFDFKIHYKILNDSHKKTYKTDIDINVSDFWEGYYDYSEKLKYKPTITL